MRYRCLEGGATSACICRRTTRLRWRSESRPNDLNEVCLHGRVDGGVTHGRSVDEFFGMVGDIRELFAQEVQALTGAVLDVGETSINSIEELAQLF